MMAVSSIQAEFDRECMRCALREAEAAFKLSEVPVGAVVVMDGEVVGAGYNRCVADCDPSAHAEVIALRNAAQGYGDFRLDGATLYVTLEPCLMCCGGLLQARISRLVFGAREPRTGAVLSRHECLRVPGIDHHIAISEGVCADESASLLRRFFSQRRST